MTVGKNHFCRPMLAWWCECWWPADEGELGDADGVVEREGRGV